MKCLVLLISSGCKAFLLMLLVCAGLAGNAQNKPYKPNLVGNIQFVHCTTIEMGNYDPNSIDTISIIKVEYDRNGNELNAWTKYHNTITTERSYYDDQQRLLTEVETEPNDTCITSYYYGSTGLTDSVILRCTNLDHVMADYYYHNESGDYIQHIEIDFDADTIFHRYEYNSNRQCIEYTQESHGFTRIVTRTFDERGNCIASVCSDEEVAKRGYTHRQVFDKKDNMVANMGWDFEGNYKWRYNYKRNKHGHVCRVKYTNVEIKKTSKTRFVYKYDSTGNWISKETIEKGKTKSIEYREFSYF